MDPFGLDVLSGTTLGDILEPISKPTKFKYDGARIYEITKKVEINGAKFKSGDYYYLDKLHKDHVETFSKNHKAKEVLNLDGTVNKRKTELSKNRIGPCK